MKLSIMAMNEQGRQAILKHMLERAKLSKFSPQKVMYNKFFEETIISEKPFTLQVRVKNKTLAKDIRYKDFKMRIEEALLKNDACPEDYMITNLEDN